MASDKVQVIQDWPEPQKVEDIQSFLDFANFYWCFILHYSDTSVLLTCLTCKGATRDFFNACCFAFKTLKESFTTTPALMHWIPSSLLIIETDAADYTLAAILSTASLTYNDIPPIAFHSCILTSAKLNYNVHNKELLTIIEVFKIWWYYLKGSPPLIDISTDHKNLSTFLLLNYSHISMSASQNTCTSSTSLSASTLDSWAPSLTCWLNAGMPILKKEEVIILIDRWRYNIFWARTLQQEQQVRG